MTTSAWQQLVTQALLGTARQPLQLPLMPDAPRLSEQFQAFDTAQPERALLDAAALLHHYRLAGQPPFGLLAEEALPTPPEAESQPLTPPSLSALLPRAIVLPQAGHAVDELLQAVSARGERLPPQLIPALFDLCRSHAQLWPLAARVSGTLGPWLARINPEWAGLLPRAENGVPESWPGGTPTQLRAMAEIWRGHDPAAARELIARFFAGERAPQRTALVEALRVGLSRDDQQLLEQAATDRSGTVVTAAVPLLLRLGGNQTSASIEQALVALTSYEQKDGTAKPCLRFELPQQFDPAWKRFGMVEKGGGGLGARTWWLKQLLCFVSPAFWRNRFNLTSQELLDVVDKGIRVVVIKAWREAAVLFEDREHALAELKRQESRGVADIRNLVSRYHHFLHGPDIESLILQQLDTQSNELPKDLLDSFSNFGATFPDGFSETISQKLIERLSALPRDVELIYRWSGAMDVVAPRIHPRHLTAFLNLLDTLEQSPIGPRLQDARSHAHFRLDLHKELTHDPDPA